MTAPSSTATLDRPQTKTVVAAAEDDAAAAALRKKHGRALKLVLGINAVMAVVEAAAGVFSHSTALVADMLDMGSDALNAGVGLFVNNRSPKWQAATALGKAAFMGIFGAGILVAAGIALFNPVMPVTAIMGIVGGVALGANALCYGILHRYRNDNLNIKSTMACTRNDMIANVGTLVAAGAGFLLASPIPDLVVGAVVSAICIKSAVGIGREAIRHLRGKGADKDVGDSCDHTPSRSAPSKALQFFKKTLAKPFNRKARRDAAVLAAAAPLKAPPPRPV